MLAKKIKFSRVITPFTLRRFACSRNRFLSSCDFHVAALIEQTSGNISPNARQRRRFELKSELICVVVRQSLIDREKKKKKVTAITRVEEEKKKVVVVT